MAPEGEAAAAEMPEDTPEAAGGLGAGGSSYVPPHLRGRGGAGEKMGGKYERDDLATLRVTNVNSSTLGAADNNADILHRSPNLPRNRISGKCSADLVMSQESSWPRIGRPRWPRASRLLATLIARMRPRLARRWTDVRDL